MPTKQLPADIEGRSFSIGAALPVGTTANHGADLFEEGLSYSAVGNLLVRYDRDGSTCPEPSAHVVARSVRSCGCGPRRRRTYAN